MSKRLTILLVAALTAACEPPRTDPADGRPVVAATLPPIADVTRAVAGGAVRVVTLLPPGAHPDTYEATPRIARALSEADLVIRVGAAADEWLGGIGDVPELVLTDGMELHGRRGPGTGNPHVWLDPIRVRDVLLPRIADALAGVIADGSSTSGAEARTQGSEKMGAQRSEEIGAQRSEEIRAEIRARADAYADSLTALDAEIRALLGDGNGRFIAAHPAWVYFAERYGLEQVGAVHASPGSELASRELARLVDEVEAVGVRAVIAEPQLGRAGVEALAEELGVPVVVADAVGGPGFEGRERYLSLMRYNARAFAEALGGGS